MCKNAVGGSLRALKSYNLQLFSPELPQSLTWLVLVIQLIKFILQEKGMKILEQALNINMGLEGSHFYKHV